ncbi:low-affinity phosphate transporter [Massospora cicadina]|nr:low-affinity phosphate transporter [Massospora cicadina]
MKFSHTIQFNAVPEWQQHYIAYSSLKKIVYQVEKDLFARSSPAGELSELDEASALLGAADRANKLFLPALTEELKRTVAFYCTKEVDLFTLLEKTLHQHHVFKSRASRAFDKNAWIFLGGKIYRSNLDADEEENVEGRLLEGYDTPSNSRDVEVGEVKTVPQLNEGSYIKNAPYHLLDGFGFGSKSEVKLTSAAVDIFVQLSELKNYVTLNYTGTCRRDQRDVATEELKAHLREHLVWERNTVWKDMIGLERKAHAVELKSVAFNPLSSSPEDGIHGSGSKIASRFLASYHRPLLTLGASFGVFLLLLAYAPFKDPEPNGCLALLVFASLLWATEVIPLFVTALLVPFLEVILGVLKSEDGMQRLNAPEATQQHGISNVAAPVLCFSLIQPLLRTLPNKSPYARSLIIGIALASNIGGMASPISSPQNIIALSNMSPPPSWLQWFAVSIPLCAVGILLVWVILLGAYKPTLNNYSTNHIRYTPEELSYTQIYVCGISLLTILLWCFSHQLEGWFGDMGVLAIIPVVAFFGTGVLSKDDFNNFLWTVIVLAMGGIALGSGVKSSGLLAIISHGVQKLVSSASLFEIMFIFCGFTLLVTTFISHTVGAVIILPIVAEIKQFLAAASLSAFSYGVGADVFLGDGASGFRFPQHGSIMMEDETGTRYLSVKDFLMVGVPRLWSSTSLSAPWALLSFSV